MITEHYKFELYYMIIGTYLLNYNNNKREVYLTN